MSIVLDFPTETAQLRAIARENDLDNDLRVFVPEDDDILFDPSTMVVFSAARPVDSGQTLNFMQRVSLLFQRRVFVEFDHSPLDNMQTLRASEAAERI